MCFFFFLGRKGILCVIRRAKPSTQRGSPQHSKTSIVFSFCLTRLCSSQFRILYLALNLTLQEINFSKCTISILECILEVAVGRTQSLLVTKVVQLMIFLPYKQKEKQLSTNPLTLTLVSPTLLNTHVASIKLLFLMQLQS